MANFIYRYPLKYFGPLILLLLAGVLVVTIFFFNYTKGIRDAKASEVEHISKRLNEMQGSLEAFLRFNDYVNIDRMLANSSLDEHITQALLVDDTGMVTAAGAKKLIRRDIRVLLDEEAQRLVDSVRENLRYTVALSKDGKVYYGIVPVQFASTGEGLRAHRFGVYFEAYDFDRIRQQILANERLNALAGTAIFAAGILVIALLVYAGFITRLERIVDAARRFTAGEKTARASMEGNDEIAFLASAFDTMVDKVVAYQRDIETYVDEIDRYIITSSTDAQGRITDASRAFCEVSGYAKEELIGRNHNIVRHPDMPAALYKEVWETITAGRTWRGEIKNRKKSGGFYWVDAIISPNVDETGTIKGYTAIRQDITDKKILADVQDSLKKYIETVDRHIVSSSTDKRGVITQVSRAFCEISGYTKEELIGKKHNILRHPDMPAELYAELWRSITSGKTWRGEIKNRKKDGSAYWVDAIISPIYDDRGAISGYTAIRHDISDKKRIEEISITDPLTGLYNRRFFNEKAEEELYRARREKKCFAFVILDVDNFKKYNDNYGHQMGDQVLQAVGGMLKSSLKRAGDYAFRLGGEEFGLLFSVRQEEDALKMTENIRHAFLELQIHHEFNDASPYVTASFGLRILDFSKNTIVGVETLYRQADEALYAAKQGGRNRVAVYSEETEPSR